MDAPRISIIMPVYNCDKYLDEAIRSMLTQTFSDFEFIIINNDSSDGTDEIVRCYLDDRRVIYEVNETNRGLVYSLNRGLDLARADIIARMDGDDISASDRLEVQYEFLKSNNEIALVGSYIELIDTGGRTLGARSVPTGFQNVKRVCFYYDPHRYPTIMFRKAAVEAVGRYRKEYEHVEDIDLYFRLILSGYRTDNIPRALLKYRVHPQASDRYFAEKARLSLKLKRDNFRQFDAKIGALNYISMYSHYALDISLGAERKHEVETLVKSALDFLEQKELINGPGGQNFFGKIQFEVFSKAVFMRSLIRSRISDEPAVYVIGDSHTRLFNNTKPFIVHHLGPATAYQLRNKTSTTKSNKRLFNILRHIVRPRDRALLVFGEIDCRIHIYNQFMNREKQLSIEELIEETVKSYGIVLEQIDRMGLEFYVASVPPATRKGNFHGVPNYPPPEYRCMINRAFNERLRQFCEKNKYSFIEVYTEIADEEGFIADEYSKDGIHLSGNALKYFEQRLGIRR